MSHSEQYQILVDEHWTFLHEEWPVVESTLAHRTEVKPVKAISHIKTTLLERLGIIPVFFFLTVLFGTKDYVAPYRNVEKGLLLLYHLITGYSLMEMDRFLPKSSFNDIVQDFYTNQCNILNQRLSKMLETMFSNINLRTETARERNPEGFKHVTLLLDGHDTRGKIVHERSSAHYSYKFKKSGLRTQIMTDVNDMILFVSPSVPCAEKSDGTMLVEMEVHNKMQSVETLAVDGGYTLFIDQVIQKSNLHLTQLNFVFPVRKTKGIDLKPDEADFNSKFGSFRSKIESTFADLGNTFARLNNTKSIRVLDPDVFNVQLKLACLLLNIKKFVVLADIPTEPHHSKWVLDNFDFNQEEETPVIHVSVNTRLEHAAQMLILQDQFLAQLTLQKSEPSQQMMVTDEEETSSSFHLHEVEKILDHKDENGVRLYLVKWKGYRKNHNTWEPLSNFTSTQCIEEYLAKLAKVQRGKRPRQK
jgi:hypothetical protein